MSGPLPVVRLFSRNDCHLCDVAKARIESAGRRVPFRLEVVDIDGDAGLVARYNDRVPVVHVNGEEAFAYRVNEKVLVRKLKSLSKRSRRGYGRG
ncbi:MAG: glutaredoxin family protein [Gemmatimonadota bacterium]|nr:glutaredoxin family protein [Gemmatimonadota bacterium]